ncbi:MAG: nucleoside deaminase [Chloroflexi bacterium]|nr:nucleoside deaminase [Chloroflexota bacterium]
MLDAALDGLNLEAFMREALIEAEAAGQAGELPIGAVVVLDGRVIGRGRARHQEFQNQIRHAELNAILDAETSLFTEYKRAILVTTAEPCPMCLGAVVMADIPHIIFAIHDQVVHSKTTIEVNPYVRRHIKSYHGGVLRDEAADIFARYKPEDLKYIEMGGK